MFQPMEMTKESRVVVFAGFVNGEAGVVERDVNDGNKLVAEAESQSRGWKPKDFREQLRLGW